MSFYVYIISDKKLGTIYIGYTNDLKKRKTIKKVE
ncbi:MAG: GIY-YIG nuclease family protein [Allomuricauda sp.]